MLLTNFEMKLNKYWLKAGSYAMLGHGAQMGFAFLNFLLLVRILPERDLGIWILYTALTAFADMARIGLTQNGLLSLAKQESNKIRELFTVGFILNIISGLIFAFILLITAPFLGKLWTAPELITLVLLYIPFTLIYGSARFIDNVHILQEDFRGIFWSKLIFGAAYFGALVWQKEGLTLWETAFWQNIAASLSLILLLLYKPHYLKFGKYDIVWVKKLFHFGKYVMGTNCFSMLYNKLDVLLLGTLLSPMAVATYNVASRILNYIELPLTGLSQILYPKVAEIFYKEGNESVAKLYERTLAILLAVMIPFTILVLIFAKNIIYWLAGASYLSATPLLQLLLLSVFPKIWGRIFGITMDAIGKPQLNFKVLIGSIFTNLLLSIVMIPLWGVKGAAWAVLLSVIINVSVGQFLLSKTLPIQQVNIFKQLFQFYKKVNAFKIILHKVRMRISLIRVSKT